MWLSVKIHDYGMSGAHKWNVHLRMRKEHDIHSAERSAVPSRHIRRSKVSKYYSFICKEIHFLWVNTLLYSNILLLDNGRRHEGSWWWHSIPHQECQGANHCEGTSWKVGRLELHYGNRTRVPDWILAHATPTVCWHLEGLGLVHDSSYEAMKKTL